MSVLRAWQGDITTLAVDAIVNAANPRMLGGGGVDGAIHRAAGPALLEACRKVQEIQPGVRCPTGEARITPAFQLPCRYVIHTVGPVYQDGASGEPQLLADCYRNSLRLACGMQLQTIAFPAISCGIYGYPAEDAARTAVAAIREFCSAPPERTPDPTIDATSGDSLATHPGGEFAEVILVAFEWEMYRILERSIGDDPTAAP